VDGAKNVAVIGHGHGWHAQLAYMLAEFFDITSAIEQGIVGMQVQVDELGHGPVCSLAQRGVEEACGWLCVSGVIDRKTGLDLTALPRVRV
jgi:hypothetical protein